MCVCLVFFALLSSKHTHTHHSHRKVVSCIFWHQAKKELRGDCTRDHQKSMRLALHHKEWSSNIVWVYVWVCMFVRVMSVFSVHFCHNFTTICKIKQNTSKFPVQNKILCGTETFLQSIQTSRKTQNKTLQIQLNCVICIFIHFNWFTRK